MAMVEPLTDKRNCMEFETVGSAPKELVFFNIYFWTLCSDPVVWRINLSLLEKNVIMTYDPWKRENLCFLVI